MKKDISKKGIVKSSVTDDTDVTDVTDDTDDTDAPVTSVTCNIEVQEAIFSGKTIDRILRVLYNNFEGLSDEEIAEQTGLDRAKVRVAINRNKEYFGEKFLDSNKCYRFLLQMGLDEINSRIDHYEHQMKEKQEVITNQKKAIKSSEDVKFAFKNYLDLNRVKLKKQIFNSTLTLNFEDLVQSDLIFEKELMKNPQNTISLFELAREEHSLFGTGRIRIINLPEHLCMNIEDVRAVHVDSMISIVGRSVTISDVRPQTINAKFECPSCGTILNVLQTEKKFREPVRCSCGRRGGFKIVSEDLVDTGRLILEDLQEKTENPHAKRLNCFLKEDLLSPEVMRIYDPGNELQVVGVLKKIPIDEKHGGTSTRHEIAIEVISVVPAKQEIDIKNFTDEEIARIKELSKKISQNGLTAITESFAPNIYGHDKIKEALVLQLASTKNQVETKQKNKPNILMIGDPGTSKTELGEFQVSITPGSRKAVGGSASAVGLTGSVVRDDFTGGWRLEPGAMVLAKDLILIDEINNQSEEDKPKLQEALSEHTITIDKATVHMKLKAEASVTATANPIHGLFKDNEDLVQQFNLSPPIINRFDLIFVVRDTVDEVTDEKIAQKMNEREMGKVKCEYQQDFLTKFFVYIKDSVNPKITADMNKKMSKIYAKLRRYKTSSLNINPRVHSAFLQLCKASAKTRLSDIVEEKDLERAIDILSCSYFKIPAYKEFKDFLGDENEL